MMLKHDLYEMVYITIKERENDNCRCVGAEQQKLWG